ncbi:MAG TPA: hypothetical protein DCZ30_02130 [Clostridiales bacterium]|nr:hypothetical protein [Clostridiales bacterium]
MKKRRNKIISLMLVVMTLMSSVCPIIQSTVEAATYVVDYHGSITYGQSKVGSFFVNGQRAFCMDHKKTTPPGGTSVAEDVYNDDNVLKCLYYGWGGDQQWGFSSEAQGVVYTTLAIDHFKNGNTNNTAKDFINYVNSMPVPSTVLNFSENTLTAYLDGETQRTQSISVNGNPNYCLTIQLQDGVSLVNETRGTTQTGRVDVYGGNTFYLRANLNVNGSWTSNNIDNHKYKYQPIIYRSSNASYQVLAGRYRAIVDPTSTINLNVNWLSTGNLIIHKVDAGNHSKVIANTTFDVFDSNNNFVDTITTGTDGIARLNNVRIGTYKLIEKSTNEYYNVDATPITANVNSGDSEITVTNKRKFGYIEIYKYDSIDNSIKIPSVEFGIYDTNNNLIGKLKTDSNGYAKSSPLDLEKQYVLRELSVNDKYILSNNEWKINLTHEGIINGYVYTLNITNAPKLGNIVVYKVDADDHKIAVTDTTFNVYDDNNNFVAKIKTDSTGVARLNNVRIGRYKIYEESTNQFYRVNTTEQIVDVKFNEDANVIIANEKKTGFIEIYKYDIDAMEKYNKFLGVSYVIFGIFDMQGNKIQEITTNKDGYAKSGELPLIKEQYIVRELKTRPEYITNEKSFTVNLIENGINDGCVYTLRVGNEHKKGNLFVEKIMMDDNTIAMGNIEFELYLVGNNTTDPKLYIGTYYTDANGEIYIKDLNTGNYMLKEVSTNRWFYLADDVGIEVKWSEEYGDTKVVLENERKKGVIKVIKTDSDFTEYALEGIKFDVYDDSNNFIETITTDSNGVAQSSRLRIDKKYKVIEKSTLENYVLDETEHTIDFTENLTKDEINNIQTDTIKELKLKNEHKKGNLVINKVDADNKQIPLEGVKFELYAKNIDAPYEVDQLIGTYTTDSTGRIEINNLWTGEFYLKEVITDIYHKLNTEDVTVQIKHDETTEVTIENEPKRGYLVIEKIDSEFSNIKIENVTFNIYDQNNNFIESIKTDAHGIAKSSLLPIENTYYVRESINNELYYLNEDVFRVNFVENLTEDDIANIENDFEHKLVVTNDIKRGSIEVIKIDADNNVIRVEGVEFDLIDEETNQVIANVVTSANGTAVIDNLRIDRTYTLIEKSTNHKYKLNENPIINITIEADKITQIQVENELKKGQVKVIKIDKDNNEVKLEGVVFEILNKDMEVIEEIATDENGEAISSKLPCIDEKYFVREKETKESYVLSDEIRKVVLEEDEISNLTFENEKIKGYIKIIKTSLDDNPITGDLAGTPIPNITFDVYDSKGNIVDILTTDSEGMATSDLLVYGQYIVKEKSSGEYWQLNTNEYVVDINENLETIEVNIKNESDKPDVDIEKTGIIQTTENQEIRYDFHIKNTGNTNLNNFTWFDYLPSDYVRMSKLVTGTYNQDLNYSIYYKTNLNDYKLLVENLNTQVNNYVDFSKIQLEEGEVITEFRADFGTVDVGFESVVNPYIFVITNEGLEDNTTFTNKTRVEGDHEAYLVWDEDNHTTKIYKKEIKVKKLPRTGF